MINCSKCGKDNQDHYKFCLGCGSELSLARVKPPAEASDSISAVAAAAVSLAAQANSGEVAGASVGAIVPGAGPGPDAPTAPPESPPTIPPSVVACGSCGVENPGQFAFCGGCGARLGNGIAKKTGVAPAAPAKAPQGVAAAAPAPKRPIGRISLIRPDGSPGGTIDVSEPELVLGRGSGPLFDGDSFLGPQHAKLLFDREGVVVEDAGSLNGLFVRITGEEPLFSGAIFRIGQELIRFDAIAEPEAGEDGTEVLGSPNPGYWGRLSLIVGPDDDASAFPLMGDEIVLGRERGDIIFSDDGYVSGAHAKITCDARGVQLADLGSSNGTFVRLVKPRQVPYGTYVLMGQQLFRLDRPDS